MYIRTRAALCSENTEPNHEHNVQIFVKFLPHVPDPGCWDLLKMIL